MVICKALKFRRHSSWLKFPEKKVTRLLPQKQKNPKNLSSNNFRLHISSNLTCVFQRKSCNPLLSNCFFKHLRLPWRLSLLREPALWMSSLRATVSGSQTSVKCARGYHVGSEKYGVFWNFFQNYVKKPKQKTPKPTTEKHTTLLSWW